MTSKPIDGKVSQDDERKKRKKRFLWVWLLILLFIATVGGAYWYLNHSTPSQNSHLVAGDFLPKQKNAKKMTDSELAQYAQKAADSSQFQLMINPISTINFDTQSGYIGIKNPNTNAYPINVTFYTSNHKAIYSSGAIQPGQEITNGTLSNKLQKGKYEIKARFDIYDNKTKKKRGQQFAVVNMTVQ